LYTPVLDGVFLVADILEVGLVTLRLGIANS